MHGYFDIDKMIQALEEFNADSVDYNLKYRTIGVLYKIKLNIELVDEEAADD